jgi:peptidoglycan/xylan/chitin deacetylase (PgdA/CDA1 family)
MPGFLRKLIFYTSLILILPAGCTGEKKPEPVAGEGKIIVLMYHRIVKGEATNIYERSIEKLEGDLMYLKKNNIKILSFSDLEAVVNSGSMPDNNCAIVTFDDGDSSWYTLVKPLLLKYHAKATFFLWTYMIGHDSFVTWNEVEDMSNYTLEGGERPFIFGSHTYSHTYLRESKSEFSDDAEYNAYLDYEMGKSKQIIESHSPVPVTILSLPYGDGAGDQEIIAAAQRNGYKFIRTSVWGAVNNSNQNLFEIPSLPILDTTESELIGTYLGL